MPTSSCQRRLGRRAAHRARPVHRAVRRLQGNYSFGTRFEGEKGTNPEELIAAAHAACLSMALSAGLGAAGTPPTRIAPPPPAPSRRWATGSASPGCGSRCAARCRASTRRVPRRRRRPRTAAPCRRRSRATSRWSWTRGWHRPGLPHAGRRRAGAERSRAAHRPGTATLLIGANLPDIDVLAYFGRARSPISRSGAAGPTASPRWLVLPFLLTGAIILLRPARPPHGPRGAPVRRAAARSAAPRGHRHPHRIPSSTPSTPTASAGSCRSAAAGTTATPSSSSIRGSGWCWDSACVASSRRARAGQAAGGRPARFALAVGRPTSLAMVRSGVAARRHRAAGARGDVAAAPSSG